MKAEDEVLNSQRRLYRVAYTPLSVPPVSRGGVLRVLGLTDDEASVHHDLLVRGAFLRALGLTADEANANEQGPQALPAVRALTDARTEGDYIAALGELRGVDTDTLVGVAAHAARLRQAEIDSVRRSIVALAAGYRETRERPTGDSPPPEPSRLAARTKQHSVEMTARESKPQPLQTRIVDDPTPPPAAELPAVTAPTLQLHPLVVANLGSSVAKRLPQALEWAKVFRPDLLAGLADQLDAPTPEPDDVFEATNLVLPQQLRRQLIAERVAQLIAERAFDVIGLLHLERLVLTPAEVDRGELLYSLPLAPKETVTLAHKEWTIHEEEYSRYIQDYLENYSETGVAQTTELSKTTDTQTRRQDATSANPTSITGQAVIVTAPVATDAGSVVDAAESAEESVTQTKSITSKASSRTIQDHRISFTVTTVKGSEDWTSRLIHNNHADRTMTIDYYRRMRRWKNELFRYGVRLTYDVVVPHPGRRLLARYERLRQLDAEIMKGFESTIPPASITPATWPTLAAQYRTPLPPPPPDLMIEETLPINYPKAEDHTEQIQLPVPAGYRLTSLRFEVDCGLFSIDDSFANVFIGSNIWLFHGTGDKDTAGIATGHVPVPLGSISDRGPLKAVFVFRNAWTGKARVYGQITATTESLEEWRKQCWGILREVELARYQQHQDALRAERLALQRAIDAADELSLRRIEREHIMLACLEWLFPFLNLDAGWFDDVADAPTDFDRVMGLQASVLIKLMHTAIDWDAMIVTLLPFFWERTDNQATVFVDHPDPLHREFLRAGAARVVLPIRPGNEEEILSLFDLGLVGTRSNSDRYKAIIDEVTAANDAYRKMTNPADATLPDGALQPAYVDDYPVEAGKMIGRWHETMPTGALDIEVTLRPVTEP